VEWAARIRAATMGSHSHPLEATMEKHLLEDPQIRQWQRVRALAGIAVVATMVAGIALVGATAPPASTQLAVNCATTGMEGFVFDDTGTYAALCAGQPAPAKAPKVADGRMPAPAADARAEPLPPTF
jgi:hypothetical protein